MGMKAKAGVAPTKPSSSAPASKSKQQQGSPAAPSKSKQPLQGSPAQGTPSKASQDGSGGSKARAGPQGSRPGSSATKPGPPKDWSEALDLPEPSMDDVDLQIQQAVALLHEPPGRQLTEDLILKNHALDDSSISCPVARSEVLSRLTHLRMDRQHLTTLAPALPSQLGCLTHVYLQHNRLQDMKALAGLQHLSFACLSHNLITQVEGVLDLPELMLLDLTHNRINRLDATQLPKALRFLKLEGNPCCSTASATEATLQAVLHQVPLLRDLDGPIQETDEETDDEEGGDEAAGGLSGQQPPVASTGNGSLHVSMDDSLGVSMDVPPLGSALMSSSGVTPGAGPWGGGRRGMGSHLGGSMTVEELMPRQSVAAVGKAVGEVGGRQLITSALDLLESLERVCVDSSMSALNASVKVNQMRAAGGAAGGAGWPEPLRTSIASSSAVSTSVDLQSKASFGVGAGPAPGSPAVIGGRSGSIGGVSLRPASPALPRAHSLTTSLSASLSSTPLLATSGSSPLQPLGSTTTTTTPTKRSPLLPSSSLTARAPSPGTSSSRLTTPLSASTRPSLDPPMVTTAYAAAEAAGPAGASPARSLSSRASGATAGAAEAGALRGAQTDVLRGAQADAAMERMVTADLAMLRVRLEGFVEPLTTAANRAAGAAAAAIAAARVEVAGAAGPARPSSKGAGGVAGGASSRPGSGKGIAAGGRPGSGAAGRLGSGAGPTGGRAGSAGSQGSRPTSATAANRPNSRPGTARRDADAAAASASWDARRGLHGELDRLMGAAAARVSEQRERDGALSSNIRALRGSVSLMAELKHSLNLKAAMAAAPGAVAAVRGAVAGGSGPGAGTGAGTGAEAVRSALERHATAAAVRGPEGVSAGGGTLAAGGSGSSTANLRASLARLEQLSVAVLLEHGADVEALRSGVGLQARAGMDGGMGEDDGEGGSGGDSEDSGVSEDEDGGPSTALPNPDFKKSKYYQAVMAKALKGLEGVQEGGGEGEEEEEEEDFEERVPRVMEREESSGLA